MTKGGEPVYNNSSTSVEQTVVVADTCVKVPDEPPLEKVCIIRYAVITAIGVVVNRAKVESSATIAVFGCGGVSLNVIQGGVLASAGQNIAVDNVPYNLELARDMV